MAVPALAFSWWNVALPLIAATRLMDGLDKAVARIRGPTDRGAFPDVAPDFVFSALMRVGFALQDPAGNGLPAAVLIAAFVHMGSSFPHFAAIAAKRGTGLQIFPPRAPLASAG